MFIKSVECDDDDCGDTATTTPTYLLQPQMKHDSEVVVLSLLDGGTLERLVTGAIQNQELENTTIHDAYPHNLQ